MKENLYQEKRLYPPWDDYAISNTGEVISYKRNIPLVLAGSKNAKGYRQVTISYFNGKAKVTKTVKHHRLVAEYFIPNPDKLATVNHIDKCVTNNHVSNLEWMTNHDNIIHGQAYLYELTHKNGRVIQVKGLQKFCKETLGKPGQGNFIKLLNGEIKSCYGFTKIERIYE